MKYFVLYLIICFNFSPCFSYTTEASKFVEQQYAKENCLSKIHINVKQENTIKNLQNFEEKEVPAISFGSGDLKTKIEICGKKKFHILYICLLDKNCKPFWSYIIPSE